MWPPTARCGWAFLLSLLTGCSLLLERDASQCTRDADCAALGFSGWVCDAPEKVCVLCTGTMGLPNSCPAEPIPSQETWRATSSIPPEREHEHENYPDNAIDGDLDTRWTTGASMGPGDWWQVDFGEPVTLTGIEVHHTHNDHLRGYEIIVSNEPPTLQTPADVQGENDYEVLRLRFDSPLTGRHFHIRPTVSDSHWWSIAEIVFLGM